MRRCFLQTIEGKWGMGSYMIYSQSFCKEEKDHHILILEKNIQEAWKMEGESEAN